MVDQCLIQRLLNMLSDLHIYQESFENKFQEETRKFYTTEGRNLVQKQEVFGMKITINSFMIHRADYSIPCVVDIA